jgi:hypothetical protein
MARRIFISVKIFFLFLQRSERPSQRRAKRKGPGDARAFPLVMIGV